MTHIYIYTSVIPYVICHLYIFDSSIDKAELELRGLSTELEQQLKQAMQQLFDERDARSRESGIVKSLRPALRTS